MTPYPNQIAGNGTHGSYAPFHLFAGEKEIVTGQRSVTPSVAFAQFEVAADVAGVLTKYTGQPDVFLVVVAQPIVASPDVGVQAPVYLSAFFNHEALVWPATVTTLDARKAAFNGSDIEVGALLGSAVY